jgi:hypothetical protein
MNWQSYSIDDEAKVIVDANDRPMSDQQQEAYTDELAQEIQDVIEDFLTQRLGKL